MSRILIGWLWRLFPRAMDRHEDQKARDWAAAKHQASRRFSRPPVSP